MFSVRQNWGEWRVMFFDENHRIRSLPTNWTSVAPCDPFLAVSEGRALFHMESLRRLASLLRALDEQAGTAEKGGS